MGRFFGRLGPDDRFSDTKRRHNMCSFTLKHIAMSLAHLTLGRSRTDVGVQTSLYRIKNNVTVVDTTIDFEKRQKDDLLWLFRRKDASRFGTQSSSPYS